MERMVERQAAKSVQGCLESQQLQVERKEKSTRRLLEAAVGTGWRLSAIFASIE